MRELFDIISLQLESLETADEKIVLQLFGDENYKYLRKWHNIKDYGEVLVIYSENGVFNSAIPLKNILKVYKTSGGSL